MKTTLKRTILMLFVAAFVFAMMPTADRSYDCYADASGSCGTGVSWYFDSQRGELRISGSGYMADYSSVQSSLFPPWYDYRSQITKVTIQSGVKSAGSNAFYGCGNLKQVVIPQGVTEIGQGAFSNCPSLKTICLPSTLIHTYFDAFVNSGLTDLYFAGTEAQWYMTLYDEYDMYDDFYLPSGCKVHYVAKSFILGGNTMNFKQNTYSTGRLPSLARPYQLSLTARLDKKMLIQWTDCKKLGADIDGYLVMRRVGSETAYTQYVTVPATQNYYYDTGITKANTNYYYIVLAYKKDVYGNYIVSTDSMSVVGLRYDSNKINPHECPAKGVSAALRAKFGLPTINKTAVTLRVGQTYDLKLTYPRLSFSTWTRWRSDKSSFAKVNSSGRVTAVSPGTVLISGRTPNGRDIRCTVTVKP